MNNLQINYKRILDETELLSVCIVGQDRYPNGSNGIAFCKDSFDEFFDHYCCGKDVLYSLGYSEKLIREKYSDPKELFFDLLKKGIGFINISYELLNETSKQMFQEYQKFNKPFLAKAKKIIVLGSSKTKPYFESQYSEFKITRTLIHPSLKAKEYNSTRWAQVWENEYLKKVGNTI